uniref:Cyclin-dependent protein kinase inhibitor SMR4 n=1 Tax=Cucumis sativus TaxID=3659 RepID=A0A0A0KXI9_CUCSA
MSPPEMEKTDKNGDECLTPKSCACRIPKVFKCPPPPKKKSFTGRKLAPPTRGYFQPPDLDTLFSMPPSSRWEACT